MEVEVKIRGLMMDPVTNMPVVVLKETQGVGILPIWVGIYEANAIALEIEKVATPRPKPSWKVADHWDIASDALRTGENEVVATVI